MDTISVEEKFGKYSPTVCYEAAEKGLEENGIQILKKRPIAWFLLGQTEISGNEAIFNLSFRFGAETIATLAFNGSYSDRAAVDAVCEKIFKIVRSNLE